MHSLNSYTYDGKAKTPFVTVMYKYRTLIEGVHYTVSYKNNVNAGTAYAEVTGIGNYSGKASISFKIDEVKRTDIANCTVTLSKNSYIYDGSAKIPVVTVKDGTKKLWYGMDYVTTYSDNVNAGTATVTVTGIGKYQGTKTASFEIKAISKSTIDRCTVTLSNKRRLVSFGQQLVSRERSIRGANGRVSGIR